MLRDAPTNFFTGTGRLPAPKPKRGLVASGDPAVASSVRQWITSSSFGFDSPSLAATFATHNRTLAPDSVFRNRSSRTAEPLTVVHRTITA
jgi:hypothetical protein